MEFGLFLNGYIPGPGAHDTDWEHRQLMREAEYAIFADGHNWKYAWFGEHHCLTEYSHMSAPEIIMGMVAGQTEYIHLASGINSLSPRKEHPVRLAERAAMLDHVTGRRYEWGTGRGAGSHEMASFNILDTDSTKSEWDEVVREIPRMWERTDYTFFGDHFTVDTPHNVLPKPHGAGHPAIWLACGNPATFAKAGAHGIGALGFTFAPVHDMKPHVDAYKEALGRCTDPVGQFVNDNVLIANGVICMETREKAREVALRPGRGYIGSLVNLYHDTFPKPPGAAVWPDQPPPLTPEALDQLIALGVVLCGSPEDVCEQLAGYERVGFDQIAFAIPGPGLTHDEDFEMIELIGRRVIPEFDRDPAHRTTRFRATAKKKFA